MTFALAAIPAAALLSLIAWANVRYRRERRLRQQLPQAERQKLEDQDAAEMQTFSF